MSRLTIRLDTAVLERLSRRAHGASLPLAAFCRDVLTQASDPGRRYIYSSNDENLATNIQVLSILATFVGQQSPRALEKGLEEAKLILSERGLLASSAAS